MPSAEQDYCQRDWDTTIRERERERDCEESESEVFFRREKKHDTIGIKGRKRTNSCQTWLLDLSLDEERCVRQDTVIISSQRTRQHLVFSLVLFAVESAVERKVRTKRLDLRRRTNTHMWSVFEREIVWFVCVVVLLLLLAWHSTQVVFSLDSPSACFCRSILWFVLLLPQNKALTHEEEEEEGTQEELEAGKVLTRNKRQREWRIEATSE